VNSSRIIFLLGVLGCVAAAGRAANVGAVPPLQQSQWNGYTRVDFQVAGRPCLVVFPNQVAPGKPWIWRTEFFGHEPQADLALLGRGWHVAYLDVKDMYGAPKAIALMGQFYAHVVVRFGLAQRVVLEGFSRGGLYAFNFAVAHPQRVGALYLDAPVLDIRSWPGRNRSSKEWAQCLEAYGLTEATLAGFRGNPLDRILTVAKAGVPILAVCGDSDQTVPYAENTAVLQQRYREAGGPIEVILKPGVDHHPHSLPDPTPIVEFLVKNAKL
jgi:pimeloyl-ACP methyl ester carboxylesterase